MARCSSSHVRTGSSASGTDGAGAYAAVLGGGDQAGFLQNGQMPHHRGQAQTRGSGQIRHPRWRFAKPGEDGPAGRIRESVKEQREGRGSCLAMSLTIA